MLSPSIVTKSKGKIAWYRAICSPTWYCSLLPVPLSPMTAKRTEPALSGSASGRSGACPRSKIGVMARPAISNRKVERLMTLFKIGLGDRVGDKIDDQIGFGITENQIAADHPVIELRRQCRQV